MVYFFCQSPPSHHPPPIHFTATTAWGGGGGSYVLQNRFHRLMFDCRAKCLKYPLYNLNNFFIKCFFLKKNYLEEIFKKQRKCNCELGNHLLLCCGLINRMNIFFCSSKHWNSRSGGIIKVIRLIKVHKLCTLKLLRFDDLTKNWYGPATVPLCYLQCCQLAECSTA